MTHRHDLIADVTEYGDRRPIFARRAEIQVVDTPTPPPNNGI